LSKDEVEKMTKEAEAHATEDAKKKEEIDAKNNADGLIFTAEKSLKDAGDKVDAAVKKEVEEKIEALKKAAPEELKTKTEDLSQALQKVGQAMYEEKKAPEEPVEGEVVK